MRFVVVCSLAFVVSACVDPLTSRATSTPEWDMENVKAYADTASGLAPETTLAWGLVVLSHTDRARRVDTMLARWQASDVSSEPEWDVDDLQPLALRGCSTIG